MGFFIITASLLGDFFLKAPSSILRALNELLILKIHKTKIEIDYRLERLNKNQDMFDLSLQRSWGDKSGHVG